MDAGGHEARIISNSACGDTMTAIGTGGRLYTRLAVYLALVLVVMSTIVWERSRGGSERAKPLPRDWKHDPAIVEVITASDIYAMGDVHGDYRTMVTLLAQCGIIADIPKRPQSVRWAAGGAVFVCTGDLIDKFGHSLQVISLLQTLKLRAAEAGGLVIITMGNHEADFLVSEGQKELRRDFIKELEAAGISPADVISGRDQRGAGKFLLGLPMAARVNDWFFCHAGNTHGMTLNELRDQLQAGIDAKGYAASILSDPDSLLAARIRPRPWWESEETVTLRDISADQQVPGRRAAAGEQRLADNLNALGVRHLVVGHDPNEIYFSNGSRRKRNQIFTIYGGMVFLIDTGMSQGVNSGRGALLKIHREGDQVSASAVYSVSGSSTLWP